MPEPAASDELSVEEQVQPRPVLPRGPVRVDLTPAEQAPQTEPAKLLCKVCGNPDLELIGARLGKLKSQRFEFVRCRDCKYTFVANPWREYEKIYSEDYYNGRGADPLVDYVYELDHPQKTVRIYEWQGIVDVVRQSMPLTAQTRWLDFGCGNGGLVRHVRQSLGCPIFGYEHGWIRDLAVERGIPFLADDAFEQAAGTFDVVTAIEVIEHVADPVAELKRIRSLLRPGGLFFLTTGNAEPHRSRFLEWTYTVPEIHVSFFEPQSLAEALKHAGFRVEFKPLAAAFEGIIRFKILKNLGVRNTATWEKMLPWGLLTRWADKKFGVTAHPIAWA
jgi:2-polyprenyl-3-methyl-5-hydroxy-6-metoxy-1,4-benzoquinol methylase